MEKIIGREKEMGKLSQERGDGLIRLNFCTKRMKMCGK